MFFNKKRKEGSSNSATRRRAVQEGASKKEEFGRYQNYRTNKTLTGSSSPIIKSVGARSAAETESPRTELHKLLSQRRRIMTFLGVTGAMLIFFIVCLVNFIAKPIAVVGSPQVVVNVSKNKLDQYASEINNYLKQNPTEHFRFMLDEDKMKSHVIDKFPEIKDIKIAGRSGLADGRFLLSFRSPIASWDVAGKRLFVDAEGVSFDINYLPGDAAIKVIDNNKQAASGRVVTSSRLLKFIGQVIATFKEQANLEVEKVEIPDGATRQINFYLKNKPNTLLKLTVDRSAFLQVEDAIKAIGFLDSKRLAPGYIDLRTKGRAYYK